MINVRSKLVLSIHLLILFALLLSMTVLAESAINVNPTSLVQTQAKAQILNKTLSIGNTGSSDLNFSIKYNNVIGPVTYSWKDSDMIDGPSYVWNDISTDPNVISKNLYFVDYSIPVDLTFEFPFYGEQFTRIYINKAGYITVGIDSDDRYNSNPLPDIYDPLNMIAPFFDYLDSYSGKIHYLQEPNKITIQYNNIEGWEINDDYTFQVVLENDGTITFYYNSMNGTFDSATIGIQNSTSDEGITVAHNELYVKNGLTVQFISKPSWLGLAQYEGIVSPGGNFENAAVFDSNNILASTYSANLEIYHDGSITNPLIVPCTFTITNIVPTASFTFSSTTPYTGEVVTLDASASSDLDGTIVNYSWDLNSDGIYGDAMGVTTDYLYTTYGDHIIGLEVADEDGATATISKTITVLNSTPLANFNFTPLKPEPNQEVTFDASSSSDSDGNILSYEWDLDGDGLYGDASGVTTSHSFTQVGTFNVRLRVTDDASANATQQKTVTVRDDWPKISLNPTSFNSNLTINNTSIQNLVINNTGSTDLDVTIKPVYADYAVVGGPDQFGYTWTDSDASPDFSFVWNDISTTGEKWSFGYYTIYVSRSFDFKFPFYDDVYSKVYITPDGFLFFGDDWNYDHIIDKFPSWDAPDRTIGGFYNDLEFGLGGDIYFQNEEDRVIIQYDKVPDVNNTGTFTFQIVLKNDGTITYYYKDMNGELDNATVGIQNYDLYSGLTVCHDSGYIKNNFAVKIGFEPDWLKLVQNTGTITPGGKLDIPFTIDTTGMNSHVYNVDLEITHNGSNMTDPALVPVTLNVDNTAPTASLNHSRAYIGYPTTLDATHSYDLDGEIQSYAWDLDGDNLFDDGTDPVLTYNFISGNHSISLKVTDDDGATNIATTTIDVVDPPQISTDVASFAETLARGDIVTREMIIYNTGFSDLNFQIDLSNPLGSNVYQWSDSDSLGGPAYVWNDISSAGVHLVELSQAYSDYEGVDLSFNFPFFGKEYDRVYISSEGYLNIGAGHGEADSYNREIPDPNIPDYLVAGFFTSLNPSDGGDIYYLDTGEQLIVQYDQVKRSIYSDTSSNYTFQIVLDVEGTITYYYENMVGALDVASIGIQGYFSQDLGIAYNEPFVKNQYAVQLTNIPIWIEVIPEFGLVPAGGSQPVSVTFLTNGYPAGTYEGNLDIIHDDPAVIIPFKLPCVLTVTNDLPTAAITYSPTASHAGEVITFDGSTSTDSDGMVVSYAWDFNNDGVFEDAEGITATYTFLANGPQTIGLEVTDNDGGVNSTTIIVDVLNNAPVAIITSDPVTPDPLQTVTLSGLSSTDIDGTVVGYAWDLDNDGMYNDGTTETVTITFDTIGPYTVGLEVIDNEGAVGTTTLTLDVNNWPKLNVNPTVFTEATTVEVSLSRILTINNTAGTDLNFTIEPFYENYKFVGGPDQFGYRWTDSEHSEGVPYVWNDISTTGTLLTTVSNSGYNSELVQLDFTFPFYGQEFNEIYVNPNGYITLDIKSYTETYIYSIPASNMPDNLIAGFFMDLDPTISGEIYCLQETDRVIFQYTNVADLNNTGTYTFQIVLAKDGSITFYYENMKGECAQSLIGIQNFDGKDGLEVVFKDAYIKNGLAIRLVNQPIWIELTQNSGTIVAGNSIDIPFTIDSSVLKSQNYYAEFEIVHNANNQANPLIIPMQLTVNNLPPVADISHGYLYKGYTVTFDATGSTDKDGKIVSYGWDLDNDGLFDEGIETIIDHIFSTVGSYPISLELVDDDGEVTVHNVTVDVIEPPHITVTPNTLAQSVARGNTVSSTLTIENTGDSDLNVQLSRLPKEAYTYQCLTSEDPIGPQYVWNDISATGILLNKISNSDLNFEPVEISFGFPFYGHAFDTIYVSSEGMITFERGVASEMIGGFPTTFYPGAIAALWHNFDPSISGDIYYLDDGKQIIIQYNEVMSETNAGITVTFQVVLDYEGNIIIYYKDLTGYHIAQYDVGIQDPDGTTTLHPEFDRYYYFDKQQYAVQFTNIALWLEVGQSSVIVPANGSTTVDVTFRPGLRPSGSYDGVIALKHNAPSATNPLKISCTMDVTNAAPVANITYTPVIPISGETITFSGLDSADVDGYIQTYAWDLNNDGLFDDGTGSTVAHAFVSSGIYTIGIRVTDNDGAIAIQTITVEVQNALPVTDITVNPESPEPGEEITLDASGTTDFDGTITSYAWDLNNDGVYDDGTTVSVTTSFATVGSYIVGLQVTDNDGGTATETVTIDVVNHPKISVAPESLAESVHINDIITKNVAISNIGTGELQYQIATVYPSTGEGYSWIDSDASNGPIFVWNDISSTGTRLNQISTSDDANEPVTLNFDFPFYGSTYNTIYVNSNGYITVGSGVMDYSNGNLPGSSCPENLIAAFFDDLNPASSGDIYYLNEVDQTIIQFNAIRHINFSSNYTFQIVLKRDGTIFFYYQTMGDVVDGATVGIQNATRDQGVQIAYNEVYAKDGLAVKIAKYSKWLNISQTSGTIPVGGNVDITATIDASGQKSDLYTVQLEIAHNGTNAVSPLIIPIELTVENLPPVAAVDYDSSYSGFSATFDATQSTDDDGQIVSYEWCLDQDGLYDDGTGSTLIHTFSVVGDYPISLKLTDDDGAVTTYDFIVSVVLSPQISINPESFTEMLLRGNTVTRGLTIQNTGGSDLEFALVQLSTEPLWVQTTPQRGVIPAGGSTSVDITFYSNNSLGTYTTNLEIGHNVPNCSIISIPCTLEVQNVNPTATITYDVQTPFTGDLITFDASGSTDVDGTITGYAWDLDNDGLYDDGTGVTITHTFADQGNYTIGVQVTDNDGATDTTGVTLSVDLAEVISNLQISSDYNSVVLFWEVLKDDLESFVVVRNTNDYPTSATDGEIVYQGMGNLVVDENLAAGTYYYAIYPMNLTGKQLLPAYGIANVMGSIGYNKEIFRYQPGNGSLITRLNIAQIWRSDLYTGWNGADLLIGRGFSGRASDLWMYYPELMGSASDQIPTNVEIERAKLVLKVQDYSGNSDQTYRFKLYQISDPDGLGTPYYGIKDGYRTGLNFQYRDARLGVEIPWATGADNILSLFSGVEPVTVVEFDPIVYTQYGVDEIQLDVTDALKAWVKGTANQGWFLTIDGDWESGQLLTLYGKEATDVTKQPMLEVVYSTQVAPSAPDQVTNVTAISGDGRVELNWNEPVTYYTGVKVVRKEGAIPFDPYDGEVVFDGNGTMMTDYEAINGTLYYYAVYTYDELRTYSKKQWVKVIPGTPETTNLHPPIAEAGAVSLNWNLSTADTYRIYRKEAEEEPILLIETSSNTYIDWNVECKTYDYWIVGVNEHGEGQPSNVQQATPIAGNVPPIDPANLYIQKGSISTTLNLNWTDQSDRETGFVIERLNTDGVWVEVGSTAFNQVEFIDENLTPSTTYEYRVKAVNIAGSSEYTSIVLGTTSGLPVAPTNLNWDVISGSQVGLTWTDSVNETGYEITVYTADQITVMSYNIYPDATSYSITGLSPYETYYFELSAVNVAGRASVVTELIRTSNSPKQNLF
ncbi:MAG: PKD domain-containing protein [Halanaerobiales bacterium]|nr:PKD domain-containing protein [Halanaerobiales bacterium]